MNAINLGETQSRQSRDSPVCGSYSIVDETDLSKNTEATADVTSSAMVGKYAHRKSVFKKRGASSPAMVRIIGVQFLTTL